MNDPLCNQGPGVHAEESGRGRAFKGGPFDTYTNECITNVLYTLRATLHFIPMKNSLDVRRTVGYARAV